MFLNRIKLVPLTGHIRLVRTFSGSSYFMIDANDGRSLDNTQEIADEFKRDEAGLNNYFDTKKASIIEQHRVDSNSAASEGVSSTELQAWLEEKEEMLEELEGQKDDAYDLASIGESSQPDDSSSPPASPPFAQDSSDVHQTDFTPFEPFDE